MEMLTQWSCMSIPLFFAMTNNLKGRAKSVSVWLFLWCQVGVLAFSTARLFLSWRASSDLAASDPYYHPSFPHALIWGPVLVVIILVLPVVWYYHDLRQERVAGKASLTT